MYFAVLRDIHIKTKQFCLKPRIHEYKYTFFPHKITIKTVSLYSYGYILDFLLKMLSFIYSGWKCRARYRIYDSYYSDRFTYRVLRFKSIKVLIYFKNEAEKVKKYNKLLIAAFFSFSHSSGYRRSITHMNWDRLAVKTSTAWSHRRKGKWRIREKERTSEIKIFLCLVHFSFHSSDVLVWYK